MPSVGRKSKAEVRRGQILDAFALCIGRYGLAESSVARVAKEAGLQRTLVFHYFGDRQGLIQALIDHQVELHERAYRESLAEAPPGARVARRLDYFFGGGYYAHYPGAGRVWNELVGIAARDPRVRERLAELWAGYLAEFAEEHAKEYPGAPRERCADVAYALICLVEHNYLMGLQGVPETRHERARRAAEALLATLESPA